MKHLSTADLIEHYYEDERHPDVTAGHLSECADCAEEYAALKRDIQRIEPIKLPQRDAAYGDRVWLAIRDSLPAYERVHRNSTIFHSWRRGGAVLAAAAVVLVVLTGTYIRTHLFRQHAVTQSSDVSPQPLAALVLDGHLDRAEQLLVQLNHADEDTAASSALIQSNAKDLMADNRLFIRSLGSDDDTLLPSVLERLQQVLAEVANNPDSLHPEDLHTLRKGTNMEYLLFQIRILRTSGESKRERRG